MIFIVKVIPLPVHRRVLMSCIFSKSFTQQEPIDENTIARVSDILRSGRLHRYNTVDGETAEAALLERDYAEWQGARYCLACASGGYALQIALRACGLQYGETVLANAYTLAPVPGAIHAAGGKPVFVEIDDNWHIDIDDLRGKARQSASRFLMLSHMRGHIADMDAICELCKKHGITLIEDCAHTMGARWKGTRSGNFGSIAAFSSQTYKHINSGEGGLLTTDDPDIAARAVMMSGSYMLYGKHGAAPADDHFSRIRLDTPNCSGRMDNVRAAIIRGQLNALEKRVERWNALYQALQATVSQCPTIEVPHRAQHEAFVGSSFQFRPQLPPAVFPSFIAACARRGVDVKWFGAEEPHAFTSRYDSWRYLDERQHLPNTLRILGQTCDIRVPLTFDTDDCRLIGSIICDEAEKHAQS